MLPYSLHPWACKWVALCIYICFLCLGGGLFSFCVFFPILKCVFLFYFILFCYYPFEACLISNGRQKGGEFRWKKRWGGIEKSSGRVNSNQDSYEIYLQSKKKISKISQLWAPVKGKNKLNTFLFEEGRTRHSHNLNKAKPHCNSVNSSIFNT